MADTGRSYRPPAVRRAVRIMELVAASSRGMGISELARALGLSKATVFGLCRELEEVGALVREPRSLRYRLGPLVAALARRGGMVGRVIEAAGQELAWLTGRLGESAFLGVVGGEEVIVVDSRQPAGRMGISAGPGTRLPITAGAVGRVVMAQMDQQQLEELLRRGVRAYTARTPTDPQVVRALVEEVRRVGYAVERDEYIEGVWGAAAGIGEWEGLKAVVWVVGFTSSLKPGGLEAAGRAVAEAAGRIMQRLGG